MSEKWKAASPEGTPLLFMSDPSSSLWLLESGFLDLVEQRLVAHAQQDRRFPAVPMDLLQRVGDHRALGSKGCFTGHLGQPAAILIRRHVHRLIVLVVIIVGGRRSWSSSRRRDRKSTRLNSS